MSRSPGRRTGRRSFSRRRPRSRRSSRGQARRGSSLTRSRSARARQHQGGISSLTIWRFERKINRLERENVEKYVWKKEGIRHQATFNSGLQEWISENLRTSLEDQFGGRIPSSLEETIKAGESKLNERTHLLKIADKYGWNSAKEFVSEDLAREEKEDKKLQRIRKEHRDKQDLGRVKRGSEMRYGGASMFPGYQERKGYDRDQDRNRFSSKRERLERVFAGAKPRKARPALTVTRKVISPGIVTGPLKGGKKEEEEAEMEEEIEDFSSSIQVVGQSTISISKWIL